MTFTDMQTQVHAHGHLLTHIITVRRISLLYKLEHAERMLWNRTIETAVWAENHVLL